MATQPKRWRSANSENAIKHNGVPTTFVETDIQGFKELVQRLTGASHGKKKSPSNPKKTISVSGERILFPAHSEMTGIDIGAMKSGFKLHDTSQVHRKLEMTISPVRLFSPNGSSNSRNLVPERTFTPITAVGSEPLAACIRNCSPSSSSTSISCDLHHHSTHERKPQLLPLFPLHSSSQQDSAPLQQK